jgi:peptidyl-prolyl cis-trans isomerase D
VGNNFALSTMATAGTLAAPISDISYNGTSKTDAELRTANTYYDARYVGQPYTSIADSLVNVSSSEVRRYYDERRSNYRQEASRDVEYVVFDVLPSAQDNQDAQEFVNNLSAEFAAAENVQQYVTLNSQDAFDPTYYSREQLPAGLAEYAYGDHSAVYGPTLENNVYTLSRVSDVRSFPDTIGFRQMALMPGSETLADSVLGALRAGADFETLAAQHSLIPVDQMDAGRISTQMIPMEIGEKVYDNRDKYVLVSNANAILLLDVYYRGAASPKVQIGTVRYYVEPSTTTQQAAYGKASAFVTLVNGDYENFNKVAADSVYSKRVARVSAGNLQVTGLTNGRELTRWAFNTKPGSISGIMEIDGNYVVGAMTDSRDAGFTPIEDVAPQIAAELRRQKKADMLAEKMTGAASLDALAQSLSAEVEESAGINFNSFFIPEVGADPALVGAICGGVAQGQLSKPVKAMTGVYVVNITASEDRAETTVENEKVRQEAVGQNYLSERAMQAMATLSNIVDNRAKYY